MIETPWFFWGAALPVIVAFAAMFVWHQPWREPVSRASAAMCWGVALFDGYLAGSVLYLVAKQKLPWPPVESDQILAMVVMPAVTVVEIIGVIPCVPHAIHWLLRATVVIATPPLLLLSYVQYTWTTGESAAWCAGLAVAIAAVWWLLDAIAKRSTGRAPWLAMMITAAGTGVAILASGSVVVGQLGLSMALAMFGTWLASLFVRGPILLRGGIGVATLLLAGLLINGCFYAELKPVYAGVLALAPLVAGITLIPAVRRMKPALVTLLVIVLTGAVVTAVAVPAAITAQREASRGGNREE